MTLPAAMVLSAAKPPVQPTRSAGSAGVLGVAVLAAVFANRGGYQTPGTFVDGLAAALTIGAIKVAIGAAAAPLIQPLRRTTGISLKRGDGSAS